MPQYQQPSSFPDWSSGQPTQVSAPTPAMQSSGFTSGQRPAFQTLNWLFYTLGGWIRYFSQGINAIMTGAAQDPGYRLVGGGMWSWNSTTGLFAWSEPFAISMPGLADASNTGAAGSVTLLPGQVAYTLSNAPFTTTGNTTSGSNQLTNLAYESGIAVGETVTGTGIPTGTTVTAISATDSSVTLSAAATATAAGVTVTFATSGPLTVQVAPVNALAIAPNTIIIARCVSMASGGSQVFVGVNSGQMLLRHLESKPLLSNGYVVTQRIKSGPAIVAGSTVYVSQGNPTDAMTYIRSGAATTVIAVYTDAVNNVTLPANQLAVGDTVVSAGGTATITAVAANNSITVSPALPFANEGFSPYPITAITIIRQDGVLYPTDASPGMPSQRAQPVGILPSATAAGAIGHVVQSGTINNFAGLRSGYPYYLNTTANAVGQCTVNNPSVPGATSTIVGVATSPTTLLLNAAAYSQAVFQGSGFKSVLDMGYWWNTNSTVAGLQSTVDAIVVGTTANAVVKKYNFTHGGSVVGMSAHFNNPVSPTTTLYVGKASGVMCSFDVAGGKLDGYVTFPKGTFTFAAGEPLFGYVYFAGQTGINCALRLHVTVEFNP